MGFLSFSNLSSNNLSSSNKTNGAILGSFLTFLEHNFQLSQPSLKALTIGCECFFADKKEVLIHAGDKPEFAYFFESGVVRQFATLAEGREVNTTIVEGPCLIFPVDNLSEDVNCKYSMAMLKGSKGYKIKWNKFLALTKNNTEIERVFFLSIYKAFCSLKDREYSLLINSAEQRLQDFNDKFRNIKDRIPRHHIASYLGMTPVTLSRLKRKKPLNHALADAG